MLVCVGVLLLIAWSSPRRFCRSGLCDEQSDDSGRMDSGWDGRGRWPTVAPHRTAPTRQAHTMHTNGHTIGWHRDAAGAPTPLFVRLAMRLPSFRSARCPSLSSPPSPVTGMTSAPTTSACATRGSKAIGCIEQ